MTVHHPSHGIRMALSVLLLVSMAADLAHADERTERIVFESDGRMREALIYAPTPDFTPHRLVVMLHGAGGDVSRIRHFTAHGLERNAAAASWIVAYPQGIDGTWNDCRRSPAYPAKLQQVDDVDFLAELIERVRKRYAIATEDVLVAGFSNGGQMALRLGLERPDAIGGVAMVAAQLPTPAESLCTKVLAPLNALLIGGTRDPLIPFAGGSSAGPTGDRLGDVLSLEETARAFAAALGLDAPTRKVRLPEADGHDDTSAELTEWSAPDRPLLRLYTLHGAGHIVPQREVELPAIVGRSAGDIDFGDVVAEFVQAWPRRLASER